MAQAEWDEAAKAAKEWFARRNRVQAWSGLRLMWSPQMAHFAKEGLR
jgi:hypothetical protein